MKESGRCLPTQHLGIGGLANIHQLEFKRWMGNDVLSRVDIHGIMVDNSKTTTPGLFLFFHLYC